MTQPQLSICIATMNRATFLEETLKSVLLQSGDTVEVVVVDGGSKDGTEELMRNITRSSAQLRYVRLEKAGGVDQDFSRAVQEARGKYCWLMSDDDILKPGAVDAVLERLDQGFSLLVVNAEVRNEDLTRIIDRWRLPFKHDRTYYPEELDRMLAEAGSYLSFIGCVVIRRDLWRERQKEPYLGSEFIHVGVIFQEPLPSQALAIAKPWIEIRYGNAQWGPRSFNIWMFKWPSLIWSFMHIAEWAKNSVVVQTPWRRTKTLLRYRAAGAYSPQVYKSMIRPVANSHRLRARAWVIAHIPGVIANVMGLIYYRWFHPSSNIQLADMRSSRFYPFHSLNLDLFRRIGLDRRKLSKENTR